MSYRERIGKIEANQNRIISGFIPLWNPLEVNGQFYESFSRTAFDGVDLSRTYLALNHDVNFAVGSVKSGTLKIDFKDDGLHWSSDVIEGADGDKVLNQVRSGVASECSLKYLPDHSSVARTTHKGKPYFKIGKVKQLADLAPCVVGAYGVFSSTRSSIFFNRRRADALLNLLLL